MSSVDSRLATLDARLRRMFADLDAREGFEGRLMRRRAEPVAHPRAARESLQAQFERWREIARRRLRREFWSNVVTIAGVGVAAGAVVLRHAPEIVQWVTSDLLAALDPMLAAAVTFAALGAGVWTLVGRSRGRL